MTCREAQELVEAIAAGDEPVSGEVRSHFEICPACAGALAEARRIESALARREAPLAPPGFVLAVQQRIRRDRWRSEQHVDRVFNLAMAVAVLLVVGGFFAIMNVQSVLTLASGIWTVGLRLMNGEVQRQAVPALNTYVAAAALLVSALGMWWWADRTWSV